MFRIIRIDFSSNCAIESNTCYHSMQFRYKKVDYHRHSCCRSFNHHHCSHHQCHHHRHHPHQYRNDRTYCHSHCYCHHPIAKCNHCIHNARHNICRQQCRIQVIVLHCACCSSSARHLHQFCMSIMPG